jgi:hypothetical protein
MRSFDRPCATSPNWRRGGVAMRRTTIIIGAAVGAIVVLGLAAGIVAYRTSSDTLVILPCDDGAGGDQ